MNTQLPSEDYNGFRIAYDILRRTGTFLLIQLIIYQRDDELFQIKVKSSRTQQKIIELGNGDPVDELIDFGLQLAHGWIDLQEFEQGKVYEYELPLSNPSDNLTDEEIRSKVLNVYHNMFLSNPTRYQLTRLDVDGICKVLDISKDKYITNVIALRTLGLLHDGASRELLLQNGGGFLTSLGLQRIEGQKRPSITTDKPLSAATRTVFYSWQSDLPDSTNRSLIQRTLEQAVNNIKRDQEVIVDRDTKGKSGSPDILNTILEKIRQADVFVCDLSFVAENPKRKLPNPNVLVEFGYAMHALGMDRIIMIVNESYGTVRQLPFDVGRFRVVAYSLNGGEPDADRIRAQLQHELEDKLREILATTTGNAVT